MRPDPKTGVMLVLAAATLWGTTGTARALAGGDLSSTWFGALRLLAAALFFGVFAALTHQPTNRRPPRSASRPTTPAWWGGSLIAVAGGVLLTGGGSHIGRMPAAGVLLCLLSGLSYAGYTLLNKRMAACAPASTITLYAFGIAAALAVPFSALEGGLPALSAPDLAAVAYTGIFTAGIAYLLFSRALLHITPATGVTLALGEPVVAFMLAIAVLGEGPSAVAFIGLALVVSGVALVVRNELQAGRTRSQALP